MARVPLPSDDHWTVRGLRAFGAGLSCLRQFPALLRQPRSAAPHRAGAEGPAGEGWRWRPDLNRRITVLQAPVEGGENERTGSSRKSRTRPGRPPNGLQGVFIECAWSTPGVSEVLGRTLKLADSWQMAEAPSAARIWHKGGTRFRDRSVRSGTYGAGLGEHWILPDLRPAVFEFVQAPSSTTGQRGAKMPQKGSKPPSGVIILNRVWPHSGS